MNPRSLAIQRIRQQTGLNARLSNGTWQIDYQGRWIDASPAVQQAFDEILAQATAEARVRNMRRSAGRAGAGLLGGVGGAVVGGLLGGPVGAAVGGAAGGIGGADLGLGGIARISGVVVGSLTALVASLGMAVRATETYSRQVISYANRTGSSLTQSNAAIQTARALGISESDMSQENSFVRSMRARMYGGTGSGGSEDVLAFARRYQSLSQRGPMGLMYGQAMARATGMEGYIDAASMPISQLSRQLGRSQTLGRSLGLNAADMRVSQEFSLLTTSLRQLAGLGIARLGAEITRNLIGPLTALTDWAVSNSGTLSEAIRTGVQTAFDYIRMFARYMYSEFPHTLLGATRSVVEFVGNLAAGFEAFRASPIGRLMFGAGRGAAGSPGGTSSRADATTAAGGLLGAAIDNPVGAGALGLGILGAGRAAVGGIGGLLRGGFGLAARGVGAAGRFLVGNPLTQMIMRGGALALGSGGLGVRVPIGLGTGVGLSGIGAGILGAGAVYEAGRAIHEFAPLLTGKPPRADRYPHLIEFPGLIANLSRAGAGSLASSTMRGITGGMGGPSSVPGVTPETLQDNSLYAWSQRTLRALDERERGLGSAQERGRDFDRQMSLLDKIAHNTGTVADAIKRGGGKSGGDAYFSLLGRVIADVAEDTAVGLSRS